MTISKLYELYQAAGEVSTDTRRINEGAIFFALKGENFNANQFADEALKKGAAYAVIDDPEYQGDRKILVADVLQCLQELALHHRRQLTIPVISLTGSNGKTTSKELMAAVLAKKYNTAFTKGNLNNHIGVPLSLLAVKEKHEMAIIEMGANHQREIAFLSSLSEPDYGYITNYGKAHLEGFGGVQGIIKGKSELYDFLRTRPGSKVFLNLDDPLQIEKSAGIPAISFGHRAKADYTVQLIDDDRPQIAVRFEGENIQSQLTGKYNYSNLAVAICVGKHFGVSTADIKAAIEAYAPSNNRSQLAKTERNQLVVDSYNANPSSIEAALKNFAGFKAGAKWVLLGDMFEMGQWAAEEHQKIADLAQKLDFEKVILTGEEFSRCHVGPNVLQFATTQDLCQYLENEPPTGKTILIKGSRGMTMEKAIPLL